MMSVGKNALIAALVPTISAMAPPTQHTINEGVSESAAGVIDAQAVPGQGQTTALIKCFYSAAHYHGALYGSDWTYFTYPSNLFEWAESPECQSPNFFRSQSSEVRLTGTFRAGATSIFDADGWTCNDGRSARPITDPPTTENLAKLCQYTISRKVTRHDPVFIEARTGCANVTSTLAYPLSSQGSTWAKYQCDGYENAGGPFISMPLAATQNQAQAHAAEPDDFPAWITYGDSLSDVGSNMYWLGNPGNGGVFPLPNTPYYHGHWGNGPNWQECARPAHTLALARHNAFARTPLSLAHTPRAHRPHTSLGRAHLLFMSCSCTHLSRAHTRSLSHTRRRVAGTSPLASSTPSGG